MRLSIAHKVKMLTLTASALLATMGAAGQRSVGSREFFVGDGVPGSVVRGMDVSEDGVLWVSGRSGLAFFDGYEFRRVGYQGATINNLTTIKAIGTKGVLGLAQNYQPYYYDISHDCFRHAMPGGIEPQCYNIYTTPGRRVWVTTRDSLFCAPFGELERGGTLSAFVVEGGLETGQFHKVEADSRGREWVFCDGGVVSAESRALVSRQTYDHIGEHSGRVFFVGRQGDVGEYDEGHQVVVRHEARRVADELMSTQTSAQGILYAGGARHLWRIDLRDERAQWEAIADGTYYLLRQDVRGRIWAVGEEEEMVVVGPGGEVRAVGLEGGPRGVSATRQPVWVEDRDGVVWAATRGGSLSYYDEGRGVMVSPEQPAVDITYWSRGCDGRSVWASGSLGVFELRLSKTRQHVVDLPTQSDVRSMLLSDDGTTWVGTLDGHVLHVGGDGTTVSDWCVSKSGVYCLAQDVRGGRMLVGTKGDGLFEVGTGDGTVRRVASAGGRNVYDVVVREDGAVGVATLDSGFSLLRAGMPPVRFREPQLKVRRALPAGQAEWLLSTKDGLWVASDGGAMRRVDIEGYHLTDVLQTIVRGDSLVLSEDGGPVWRIGLKDVLEGGGAVAGTRVMERNVFGEQVQSLALDASGGTWLIGETKVGVFSKEMENGVFVPLDGGRKMQYTEALPPSGGDRIAVGGRGFVLYLHTDEMQVSDYEPMPLMTEMELGEAGAHSVLLGRDTIVLPPETRNFSLSFTALDPSGQEKVQYAYCLNKVGDEPTCMPPATTRRAQLLSIGPGTHVFKVRCTNADGRWSGRERRLTIVATPYFYERQSFMALVCVLCLCLVAVGVRMAWVEARRRRAAEEDARRLAFLTDVSHRLRTPLTLIGGPLGQVLEREELSATGRTYLQFAYDSSQQMLDLLDRRMQDEGEPSESAPAAPEGAGRETRVGTDEGAADDGRTKILVVEDNDSLRYFLETSLAPDYRTVSARNGQEGLEKARREAPDFVVTDISMPVMDGMEMVRAMKGDSGLSHLPIIILSAKTDLSYRIEGLEAGVDDYITKPFSVAYLKSRVGNIVRQREALQSRVSYSLTHPESCRPAEMPQVGEADRQFIGRLRDYLESNYGDAGLRIEDLSAAMGMGRTVFFSKVKSITGMAPVDLLRRVRLGHAAERLARTDETVGEVAYAVGFGDPKYFARSFKEFSGKTPTEYRRERGADGKR